MVRNPHRKGTRASTSFSKTEVDTALAIFNTLFRGGDAAIIARGTQGRKLLAKFQRLKQSIDEKRSGVDLGES